MFDLNYFNTTNAVRQNADRLNDYSKLKNVMKTKEDYENVYLDLMAKYKLSYHTYSVMRVYDMMCFTYFNNYDDKITEKKLKYIKSNSVNVSQKQTLQMS